MHTKKEKRRCYLRTLRRNWGLTQRELATLIGTVRPNQVSNYENSKRAPKIEVALACQVIFGVPPSTMFPNAYALAEEEVMRNMYRMDQALENTTSIQGMRKRELFALALERAVRKPKSL
jgi:transcriptional regulator with XRE-family HTH domain